MPPIIARTICGGIPSRPGIWSNSARDELLEGVDRPLDHGDRLGPGGVDLDEAHLRGGRLGGDQLEEGFDGDAHPLLAAAAPSRRAR